MGRWWDKSGRVRGLYSGSVDPATVRVPDRRAAGYILGTSLLFTLLIHIPEIPKAPYGLHQWRQVQTLAVARNLHEEAFDPLSPRVDGRGAGTGVAGMEFPFLNALIAAGYGVFGFSHAVGRLTALAFGLLAILGVYLLGSELFGSKMLGACAGLFLSFSPLFIYYSAAVMPDVPMLSMLFFSLFFFAAWERKGRPAALGLAAGFLGIAGLIKITALIAVPYYLWVMFRRKRKPFRDVLPFTVPLGAIGAWYLHARHLSEMSGIHDFKLEPTALRSAGEFLRVTRKILFSGLPEVYMNYGAFIFLVIGVIAIIRLPACW